MLTRNALVMLLAGTMGFTLTAVQAEDKPAAPAARYSTQTGEPIYGRQFMTPEERREYRARMRAARTDAECDAVRAEHHKKMQEKAKEKGVTLPQEPLRKGCAGPRRGMGGMGPGMRGQ